MKLSRNAPCPCGSGKKYKRCCLPFKQSQISPRLADEKSFIAEIRPELDDAVDHALASIECGDFEQAGKEIARLLQENPDYHQTNYAMGVYEAMVSQRMAVAMTYFEKAVAIFPMFVEAQFNLANTARHELEIPKAIDAFRAVVRYAEDDDLAARAQKELDLLADIVVKGTSFTSLDEYLANKALFDRAFECLSHRQYDQAAKLFQEVLKGNPGHVQSHGNLGLAYAGLGRRADALASFDRALELDPDYAPARQNRLITSNMREGEPFRPEIHPIDFSAERIRNRRD